MLKAVKFAAVLVILVSMPALAEINGALRIGVLNDMSSVYADFQGPGSVLAAQIAVEDFAKQSKRKSLMWVLASRAVGLTLRASI